MRQDLPTGTVTFMFTDMEGSTRLVQHLGDRWPAIVEQHDDLVRTAVVGGGGVEVRTVGDAFFAAFASASDAVGAAADIQTRVHGHTWPEDVEVRVRIGLHTGVGALGGADYVGLDVHRAARISAVAHGGQVVLSEATAALIEQELPTGVELRDLGKHRLKDLLEREALYQLVVPGVPDDFPPLLSLEAVVHNLPVQVTSFVGREDDVSAALELLETRRILTLLGPGGIGKTRLAMQVAAEAADRYADGVCFVPLAPVTDGDLIPSTILGSLGVPVAAGGMPPLEQLSIFLRERALLLVLDNFEQLVESAGVVSGLVAASPQSSFLITSRVPLHISGEQQLPIPPLDLATESASVEDLLAGEAVHLFVERAQAVRPDFELTDTNAAAVARLVERLDGLPLAIELVVPKLKMLPIESVLERLDTRLLSGGARDAPERHQTMWNAIAWSEDTLSESDRRLFWHLSVFSGSARLEDIEAVCAGPEGDASEVIDLLATLVDNSLVTREDDRFRMLQVIREYAAARLEASGEAQVMRDRHATVYRGRIDEALPHLMRRERLEWLTALDADHDNLRAAMAHTVGSLQVDAALGFAFVLWRYWQMRGHLHEGRRRIDEALTLEGGDPALRAKALEALGGIAWWQGDSATCERAYEEALLMQRELGDEAEIANALYNHALAVAFFQEDIVSGRALMEEAREIYEKIGDRLGLANVHWGFGNLWVMSSEEPGGGIPDLERCIDLYREVGNVFGEGWAHYELGEARRRLGEYEAALPHLRSGLDLLHGSGELSAAPMFLMSLGGVAGAMGEAERSARIGGAAWALVDETGSEIATWDVNRIPGMERDTLEALTGRLAAAYQEGRAMSHEEAVAYALGTSR